ncbi:hypothetical protein EDD11_001826 [Mortierella claussenii]|nr:hypothetical protein EDD11_001826 [Mortierella claussenii]
MTMHSNIQRCRTRLTATQLTVPKLEITFMADVSHLFEQIGKQLRNRVQTYYLRNIPELISPPQANQMVFVLESPSKDDSFTISKLMLVDTLYSHDDRTTLRQIRVHFDDTVANAKTHIKVKQGVEKPLFVVAEREFGSKNTFILHQRWIVFLREKYRRVPPLSGVLALQDRERSDSPSDRMLRLR